VPLAALTAVIMLVGWFPLTTLWHQQRELNAAAAQIAAVKQQSAALKAESKAADTKAAATELARSQYQLVAPGQSLIQILPGNAKGQLGPDAGDPGFQPLVSPTHATLPVTVTTTHHARSGFFTRLVRTLEFWR